MTRKNYFIATIFLFITEVLIALFVNDRFIRPHVGDLLVVILIYCLLKAIFKAPSLVIALSTLGFSILVETLQYFRIVEILGLENNTFARIIIGTSFSWLDIISYVSGIAIILIVEKIIARRRN